jgi:AcrR family transcriptional regulator
MVKGSGLQGRGPSRRECLVASASRLFAEHGYEGTTIRQIARECGITEAAIYKHFDGKDKLYEEVIHSKSRQHEIRAYLATQTGIADIEAVLFTVARHILATAREDPDLLRMLLYSSLEGFRGSTLLYREFRQPYIAYLREELRERIASGEIQAVNPFITSRCFVGMVMDCALNVELWNNLESTAYSADAVIENNVPLLAGSLRRGAPSPRER